MQACIFHHFQFIFSIELRFFFFNRKFLCAVTGFYWWKIHRRFSKINSIFFSCGTFYVFVYVWSKNTIVALVLHYTPTSTYTDNKSILVKNGHSAAFGNTSRKNKLNTILIKRAENKKKNESRFSVGFWWFFFPYKSKSKIESCTTNWTNNRKKIPARFVNFSSSQLKVPFFCCSYFFFIIIIIFQLIRILNGFIHHIEHVKPKLLFHSIDRIDVISGFWDECCNNSRF